MKTFCEKKLVKMLHHYTNLQTKQTSFNSTTKKPKPIIQIYLYFRKKQNFHPFKPKKKIKFLEREDEPNLYIYTYIHESITPLEDEYWKHIIGGNEAWSENTTLLYRSRRRVLEPDNIPLKKQSFLSGLFFVLHREKY